MTTALIVWADEKARIGRIKTKILRAIREWVGHCENCGATTQLTVHHCGDSWIFDIVIYCKQCHSFWHWLIDPKRGTGKNDKDIKRQRRNASLKREQIRD